MFPCTAATDSFPWKECDERNKKCWTANRGDGAKCADIPNCRPPLEYHIRYERRRLSHERWWGGKNIWRNWSVLENSLGFFCLRLVGEMEVGLAIWLLVRKSKIDRAGEKKKTTILNDGIKPLKEYTVLCFVGCVRLVFGQWMMMEWEAAAASFFARC